MAYRIGRVIKTIFCASCLLVFVTVVGYGLFTLKSVSPFVGDNFSGVTPISRQLLKEHKTTSGNVVTVPIFASKNKQTSTYMDDKPTTTKSDLVTTSTSSTKSSAINPHPFNFTINEPDFCSTNSSMPFLLIVVHSHPHSCEKRQGIRDTWGNANRSVKEFFGPDFGIQTKVLFVLGSVPDDSRINFEKLQNESDSYRDIIQENFADTYENLSLKAIMWMKWVTLYCPEAWYVLKVDNDVFVNMYTISKFLRNFYENSIPTRNCIMCRINFNEEINRDKTALHYVSEDDLPGTVFMPYCSGPAYFFTAYMTKLLYEVSLNTKFLWIEDVFITGVLPLALKNEVNVTYYDLQDKMALWDQDLAKNNIYEDLMLVHMTWFKEYTHNHYYWWNLFLEAREQVQKISATTSTLN